MKTPGKAPTGSRVAQPSCPIRVSLYGMKTELNTFTTLRPDSPLTTRAKILIYP